MIPTCSGCGKHPDELQEYIDYAKLEDMSPDEYVEQREPTYNAKTRSFFCTPCYYAAFEDDDEAGYL